MKVEIKLTKPFIINRPDTCPHCSTKRSIELYNYKDKPLNYSVMLDQHIDLKDKIIGLSYMKCKKCGSTYFPRWQDNIILPTEDMNVGDFMALYKAMKKKAEST